MKIIKAGDLSRVHRVLRFDCQKCGCVFEANENEYEKADCWAQMHDNEEAYCKCPCCGNRATRLYGKE